MNFKSNNWIGIDLGTYNSSAAIKTKEGTIEIIRSSETNSQIDVSFLSLQEKCKEFPSFISFDKDGIIEEVGMNSKEKSFSKPEYVVWGIKRLLGKTYIELSDCGELERFPYRIRSDRNNGQCLVTVGDKSYTPIQLCSEIFKKIKSEAESQIQNKIDSVVISVPAYFDPIRVTPIVEAARLAGFNNIKSIPEPVAAALAYKIDITVKPIKTLVFDLGAGTLDVTTGYMYRHPDQPGEFMFQVMKNTGDSKLGGMDMDDRLQEFIINKFDIKDISKIDQITIRRIAEISKIRLSEESNIEQEFQLNGINYKFSLNQYELKSLLEGSGTEKNLLEECRRQIMSAINEIKWNTQEIEQIILIGGPTKLPCIHEVFKVIFNSNPIILRQLEDFYNGNEKVDRMTAVSVGAALSVDRNVNDIVPYGHGFEDIEISEEYITRLPNILVPRDSPYPYKSKPYLITWYNQAGLLEFKILQQVPKSEIDHTGSEYRFVGVLKFAVKNPDFSMVIIQMGYNSNKELEVVIYNALSYESATYVGINNYAFIGMKYPMSVKRIDGPDLQFEKIPPSTETLEKFTKWSQVIHGFIKIKAENYPISQMMILQILDEISLILRKNDCKSDYEMLYTKINSLIWNSSSKGLLSQSEFNDLNSRICEFQNEIFRFRKK